MPVWSDDAPPEAADRARERFRELAALPDERIDLATGALLIAAEHDRQADVAAGLQRLEALADMLRPRLEGAENDRDRVERLNRELFQGQRFRGNRDEYYDARNSFLNAVLERRRGIPISLSILYVDIARRLGLDACGVSFPGHFLAKVVSAVPKGGEIVVDAFEGQVLSPADCAERLRNALGPAAELRPQWLAAAGPRPILTRVLGNLKQIYWQGRQPEAALRCCDRILLLDPEAAFELRDRGLVLRALGCFAPAADDLERFLALQPGHESAPEIRGLLASLRQKAARLH